MQPETLVETVMGHSIRSDFGYGEVLVMYPAENAEFRIDTQFTTVKGNFEDGTFEDQFLEGERVVTVKDYMMDGPHIDTLIVELKA